MGEDSHCANQTRYFCGNSLDDPVLDIWGVADSLVPQEKSAVTVQRKRSDLLVRNREQSLNNAGAPVAEVLDPRQNSRLYRAEVSGGH